MLGMAAACGYCVFLGAVLAITPQSDPRSKSFMSKITGDAPHFVVIAAAVLAACVSLVALVWNLAVPTVELVLSWASSVAVLWSLFMLSAALGADWP